MKIRLFHRWSAAIAISLATLFCDIRSAAADLTNDVPSCYKANHVQLPSGGTYSNLVYVLIDQTVQWNDQLEHEVINNLHRLLVPGTKFVITEFSAFSQGRYLQVLKSGIIETPLSLAQEGNTPEEKIAPLKQCLHDQFGFAELTAERAAVRAMRASTDSLDQSDVMAALKTIALAVKTSPARHKVLIVASDGLENSSITSFYGAGTVRVINPAAEMAKAEKASVIGDFAGTRVYFVGGALMPPPKHGTLAERNGYRSPTVLHALSEFWHDYFAKSDADLVDFGEPSLVVPASYGHS